MPFKKVVGKPREEYSFLVKYEEDDIKYGMYVWGENTDDAKRNFRQRVPEGRILEIEMKWPSQ